MKKLWLALGLAMASLSVSASAQTYPEIDFSERPGYISNNTLSLSFDDGPDWQNTGRVLDVLRDKNVKATFFINSENWSNLWTDGAMRDLVKRMVNEGHELANHTQRHDHLNALSNADVEAQIANVENVVRNIFNGGGPRLTLLRAPHGVPYQGNNPAAPSADYKRIAPIVAKHAVHIGWGVDTFDYNCTPGDGNCVYNNFVSKVKTPGQGAYGSVLLHSVHSQTANALPAIIDYARSKGFRFVKTEDLVRARFGKSSAELVGGTVTPPPPPPAGDVYELVNRHANKCLDVAGSGTANGTKVQQWSCNNTNAQRFRLRAVSAGRYNLVNVNSGKCLDLAGPSAASGTTVHQWDCHAGTSQQFTLQASNFNSQTVRSVFAGKCLDIDGPSTADGQKAQIWDCSTGPNQDWYLNRK